MDKDGKPLVSICTTFFNAEKYIRRLIQSCLNQTYGNIEIVLVDEASIDASQKIVEEYTKYDSRVKYFRLDEKIGIAKCLKKTFEFARGRYVIFPGADDWLARDFIEKGVNDFEKYPDAAGIVPKIITLLDTGNNQFEYHSEINISSDIYSREWFVRRLYRSTIGVSSIMAFVRREDAQDFMEYFMKEYYDNLSFPEQLRKMYLRLFGTDMLFFLHILRNYKSFVWDNSLIFLKIIQYQSITFDSFNQDSVAGIFKWYYYHFLCYAHAYQQEYLHFYRGIKIFIGSEMLSTTLIYFFKSGFKSSFLNITESRKLLSEFFADFSFFEIVATIVFFIPRIIYRFFSFAARSIFKKRVSKKKLAKVIRRENFLNSEGNF